MRLVYRLIVDSAVTVSGQDIALASLGSRHLGAVTDCSRPGEKVPRYLDRWMGGDTWCRDSHKIAAVDY